MRRVLFIREYDNIEEGWTGYLDDLEFIDLLDKGYVVDLTDFDLDPIVTNNKKITLKRGNK